MAPLTTLEEKEVRDEWLCVEAAQPWFTDKWTATEREQKPGLVLIATRQLNTLDPIAAKGEGLRYTTDQLAWKLKDAKGIDFTDILPVLKTLYPRLLQIEDPLVAGFTSEQLGPQFLPILQHQGITSIPVGNMTSNPANNVGSSGDAPREPDTVKYVWASLDSNGGIALRGWRDRRVPRALIAWHPKVNAHALRELLNERRQSCERLCRLHVTKVIELSELRWVKTNMAMAETAFALADHLCAKDAADSGAVRNRQLEYQQTISSGMQTVNRLKANSPVAKRAHLDHITVAFAAAYLDHYTTKLRLRNTIASKHYPKLLVEIAFKYSSKERGDTGRLTLKPYDSAGAFLTQLVNQLIHFRNKCGTK